MACSKPPSSPGKIFPPHHVMVIWREGSQEQAGWIATEEDVPVWLPNFSGMSGFYLHYSTLQCVQSQSRKHEHVKTMHVAASPQEPGE